MPPVSININSTLISSRKINTFIFVYFWFTLGKQNLKFQTKRTRFLNNSLAPLYRLQFVPIKLKNSILEFEVGLVIGKKLGWPQFYLQNCWNSFWHKFKKVLLTLFREAGLKTTHTFCRFVKAVFMRWFFKHLKGALAVLILFLIVNLLSEKHFWDDVCCGYKSKATTFKESI